MGTRFRQLWVSLVLVSNHCFALCSSHTSHPLYSLDRLCSFLRAQVLVLACSVCPCLPPPPAPNLTCSYSSFKSPLGSNPLTPPQDRLGLPINSYFFHSTITRFQLLANIRKNELKQHSDQGNSWEIWPRFYFSEIFDNT